MEALFLTPAELVELTGRKTSAGQRCWLDANGYRFALNANSRPIVARGHVLARLGASQADDSAQAVSAPRPNFAAIAGAS